MHIEYIRNYRQELTQFCLYSVYKDAFCISTFYQVPHNTASYTHHYKQSVKKKVKSIVQVLILMLVSYPTVSPTKHYLTVVSLDAAPETAEQQHQGQWHTDSGCALMLEMTICYLSCQLA